ncbi:MAG: uroporphyrinogen decarboxylase [Cytophagales bacterium]|nr:uroporphyrinogen decarboxylase [Cytophagales bacterium]
MLQNDLILKAAKGEAVSRTPVWLMRQAGRVLKEYRAVRNKFADFKQFVQNPEAAAEVTVQPVDIFKVDAAIIFSDILVVPEAMGLPYQMAEAKGPYFEKVIKNLQDVDALHVAEPESSLKYVTDAIAYSIDILANRVPLIGFAGAPWTIFAYMVEGSGSKNFSVARRMLYTEPELSHKLLHKIALSTAVYLQAQIAAGVHIIQIFDSWAGILPHNQYIEFGINYIKMIVDAVKAKYPHVPIIVFCKDAYNARAQLSKLNIDVLGMDWCMDPVATRNIVGTNITLQGNLDPCVLYGSENDIKTHTQNMLTSFGKHRHIANLGHGLYPDIEADKIKHFVEAVQNYKD